MARDKTVPRTPPERIYPAKTDDALLSELLGMRDSIDGVVGEYPDLVKPHLCNLVSAIDGLADALRTLAALERSDA